MDGRVKPGHHAVRVLSIVIVGLDRTIQYTAACRFILERLWNTGSPAGACHRAARCADPVAGDDG
jgi:hypothetical protein